MTVATCPFCTSRFAARTERDSHVMEAHTEHTLEEKAEAIRAQRLPAGAHKGAVLRGPW